MSVSFEAPPVRQRLDHLDIAKGIAIMAVVLGHVLRGLEPAGIIDDGYLYRAVDSALYAFHIPVFFVAAGAVFSVRGQFGASLLRRAAMLLVPLVVWSWIEAGLTIAAGGAANRAAPTLVEALSYPWPPKSIYWFLFSLFFCQVVGEIVQRAVPATARTAVMLVLIPISGALAYLQFDNAVWTFRSFLNLPYFLLGILIVERIRRGPHNPAIWFAAFAAALLFAAIDAALYELNGAVRIGIGLASGAGLIFAASALRDGPVVRAIILLGRTSFAIYVAHLIFTAGTRIALMRVGIVDPAIHIAAGLIAGVAIPLIAVLMARRLGLSQWLLLDPPDIGRGGRPAERA
jgi:fucose 4-O-acetylase-like acetyltransferase